MTERFDADLHTILFVDADIVVRSPLASYLRDCGFKVLETGDTNEAKQVLSEHVQSVSIILCDAATVGTEAGFAFSQWVRTSHPDVPVLLAGNVENAVAIAGDLCEEGPSLSKPYDPSVVVDAIRQAIASRSRNSTK